MKQSAWRSPNSRLSPLRIKGFTLLEVMVALVIFALVATVIQKLSAQALDQYRWLELKTMSTWIAQNKLAELRLGSEPVTAKTFKEDITYGRAKWRIQYAVSKTSEAKLFKVVVDVENLENTDTPIKTLSYEGYFNVL